MEVLSMVGEAIISPLTSDELLKYVRGSKVLEEVMKLEPMVKTIYKFLDGEDEQQMSYWVDSSFIKEIRYLAYDVEDGFADLIVRATQRKFLAENKVGKFLPSGLTLTTSVKFSSELVDKAKALLQRLELMASSMDRFKNIPDYPVNEKPQTRYWPRISLAEPKVFGRKDDLKAILEMMKNEAGGDRGISVIPIVGMAGVGKTTLAEMVYNDVESLQFDFKVWVYVGDAFDLITATRTIVQPYGVQSYGDDLNSLQSNLNNKLYGKKFLVVLDDLRSDDLDNWTRFKLPFLSGAPGSTIIITTRSNKVSLVTNPRDAYVLQTLSYEDSLSLFAHWALGKEDFIDHTHLLGVGQEIVKRCQGLPLAIKALAGALQGKPYFNVWEEMLENKFWEDENNILGVLRWRYSNLSPHLRRCFAYCAIFPKEYEFVRDELVLLWLAEGFLPDLRQAYNCFDKLFARSFFQKSTKDTSVFLMHSLIHDLARSINKGVCLNLDEERSSRESYMQMRHLAFNCGKLDVDETIENFQHMKCLRTIVALPIFKEWRNRDVDCITSKVLDVWIPKLKLLRVLSLSGYSGVELPKSIQTLLHLRYLNMECAKIFTLPDSVCKLFNLQVLILRNCKNLRKLPGGFCNLISLQCLDLRGTDKLEEMPLHMGNLSKLDILTKFIVGSGDGSRIKELLKIPNLQGEVYVKELQNVVNMDYKDCRRMKEKEKIDGLVLEWTNNFDVFRDVEIEKQVFEALQPPENVTRMSIKSYGGTEFPLWFGIDSFKMTVVQMHNCRNVSWLPPLGGLPSLKELSIQGMGGVKEVGVEFYGAVSSSSYSNVFPSLEILDFRDMENWKVWYCFNNVEYDGQVFPKLKKLGIRCCPELIGDFPRSLDSLEELVIEGCKEAVLKLMPNLESLTKLEINEILGLESFQEAFPKISKSLQELRVIKCDELQYLWENGTEIETLQNQLHSLTSLTTLWIVRCPKLATLGDLPDNMKEVKIICCDSLEKLPNGIMVDQNWNSDSGQTSSIEELVLRKVKHDSLIIPSNEVFPSSLKSLSISEGLERQLLGSLQLQNHLSCLTTLVLEGSLESFPDTGLHIPTLLDLNIGPCGNLRSLPCHMDRLTSLQTLHLRMCPKVESFPKHGMPPNLSKLSISHCDSFERQPLLEWRLDQLSYLQNLSIAGAMEMIFSFPHDSLLLPTSLITLNINGFQNLKSISSLLLRQSSLQELYIESCPKLKYLSKEGLPPSLWCIHIGYCPLLEKQLITGDVKTRMGLSKYVRGWNNRVNVERLPRPLPKAPLAKPKVSGREDGHKPIRDMMDSEEQFLDDLAEINPLGVAPSLREQHAGRRRPDSEECFSVLVLGISPSIKLVHLTSLESTSAPNGNRSCDDLLGCCPSMNEELEDHVRSCPSLGLAPENSPRYMSGYYSE